MPAAIAIPAIIGAAGIGAQVYGAHKAAGASKDAAKIQSDAANRAIDYSQRATDQSLDFLRTNQDRANGGGPSSPRSALSTLLGLNPTTAGGGSYGPMAPTSTGVPPRNTGIAGAGSPFTMPGQPSGDGTVLMRAPNGQTKRVPQAAVEHYKQAIGAQVIG